MKKYLLPLGSIAITLILATCSYDKNQNAQSHGNPDTLGETTKALATFDEFETARVVSEQCNFLLAAHMYDYTGRYEYVLRNWVESELKKAPNSNSIFVKSALDVRRDHIREQTLKTIKNDGCGNPNVKNIIDRYNRGFPEHPVAGS